jgi:hypothetical protein
MTVRKLIETDRTARLARLEAENARLRRLAAELAADVGELKSALGGRRGDGAVDPAHRLLVVSGSGTAPPRPADAVGRSHDVIPPTR